MSGKVIRETLGFLVVVAALFLAACTSESPIGPTDDEEPSGPPDDAGIAGPHLAPHSGASFVSSSPIQPSPRQ